MPTKDNKKENVDELTTDELLEKIEADKKQLKKSSVFAFVALIAIIALGIAWFVSNNRVSGTLGTVSAKYSGIEIGSTGSAGVHDDFLQRIKKNITYHLPGADNTEKAHDTSQGASLNWLMNENSNMNNYSDGNTFDENGEKNRKDFAMEPGTKGKLDFFVKSDESGDLSLNFSLNIEPFHIGTDNNASPVQDDIARNLLNGHILYFLKAEKEQNYTWIKDGNFQIEIKSAEKNVKYNYSIYWVWPSNLSTVLLNQGDPLLNNASIEFDDKDSTGTLRNAVVEDMQMNPDKYFYSSLTGQGLNLSYDEVKEIPNIHENSGSNNVYNTQLFVDLSSYYNQADMKIGERTSFIEATLEYLGKSEVKNGN